MNCRIASISSGVPRNWPVQNASLIALRIPSGILFGGAETPPVGLPARGRALVVCRGSELGALLLQVPCKGGMKLAAGSGLRWHTGTICIQCCMLTYHFLTARGPAWSSFEGDDIRLLAWISSLSLLRSIFGGSSKRQDDGMR